MSNTDKTSLRDLADGGAEANTTTNTKSSEYEHSDMYWGSGYVWGFLCFIILWVIIYFIIVSTKPEFIFGKECDRDSSSSDENQSELGKALLWSFFITLIIVIIIWILYAVSGYSAKSC